MQVSVLALWFAGGLPAVVPGWCDCSWTLKYACPSASRPGTGGCALEDGSGCLRYCCPPPPPPNPLTVCTVELAVPASAGGYRLIASAFTTKYAPIDGSLLLRLAGEKLRGRRLPNSTSCADPQAALAWADSAQIATQSLRAVKREQHLSLVTVENLWVTVRTPWLSISPDRTLEGCSQWDLGANVTSWFYTDWIWFQRPHWQLLRFSIEAGVLSLMLPETQLTQPGIPWAPWPMSISPSISLSFHALDKRVLKQRAETLLRLRLAVTSVSMANFSAWSARQLRLQVSWVRLDQTANAVCDVELSTQGVDAATVHEMLPGASDTDAVNVSQAELDASAAAESLCVLPLDASFGEVARVTLLRSDVVVAEHLIRAAWHKPQLLEMRPTIGADARQGEEEVVYVCLRFLMANPNGIPIFPQARGVWRASFYFVLSAAFVSLYVRTWHRRRNSGSKSFEAHLDSRWVATLSITPPPQFSTSDSGQSTTLSRCNSLGSESATSAAPADAADAGALAKRVRLQTPLGVLV